ncbi:MAG: hypothetical protein GXO89_12275, partial [Chlorobi bacterium]|nr:hypothetical protein [Chlorobiota bacterium]
MKNINRFTLAVLFAFFIGAHFQSFCMPQAASPISSLDNSPELQNPVFDNEDFGDAPESPSGAYPTTLFHNGARHTIVPGVFLGSQVDFEPDGQPGINADCDDTDCLFPSLGDDEDGVGMPSTVSAGATVDLSVTASVAGFLDAWMDFNLLNGWADAGEHIFMDTPLTAGPNALSFVVPANAVPGQSYVRFRFRD